MYRAGVIEKEGAREGEIDAACVKREWESDLGEPVVRRQTHASVKLDVALHPHVWGLITWK